MNEHAQSKNINAHARRSPCSHIITVLSTWILKNCKSFRKALQYQISQKLFGDARILLVRMDGETGERGDFNHSSPGMRTRR